MATNARFDGPYYVVNRTTGKVVESHPTRKDAERACAILQTHADTHGHAADYRIEVQA